MTDTLLHLDSKGRVADLFERVFIALEAKGKFILTFRDLSDELSGLDRFIPSRSDDKQILTCFLEYEPETVKVHDLLYRREGSGWVLNKSFYRKLRLSKEWVVGQLTNTGFHHIETSDNNDFVTVIATK